jgi:hypothetical protein
MEWRRLLIIAACYFSIVIVVLFFYSRSIKSQVKEKKEIYWRQQQYEGKLDYLSKFYSLNYTPTIRYDSYFHLFAKFEAQNDNLIHESFYYPDFEREIKVRFCEKFVNDFNNARISNNYIMELQIFRKSGYQHLDKSILDLFVQFDHINIHRGN